MLHPVLAALSLLLAPAPPAAGESCGWLPASEVDAALPAFAPWSVLAGGPAGSCKLIAAGNAFGANQVVKGSAEEAASFVRALRASLAEGYAVAPAPELGAEGFTYRARAGDLSARSLYFVAHGGAVAVIASLALRNPVTPEHREAAMRLIGSALALGEDPQALAAATDCPWFAPAVLRQLLPGDDLSQQRFGSNSCMAQAAGSVVLVTVVETPDPQAVAQATGRGCSRQPVAALGPGGEVQWACPGGRPHAKVRYRSGSRLIEYAFTPGREPTAEQRALLIELAQQAPARRE